MDGADSNELATIRRQLNLDRVSAELKWYLFRAALFSYKRDFLLRPFPPCFRKGRPRDSLRSAATTTDDDGDKDFEKLMHVAKSIPPLSSIHSSDDAVLARELSPDQMRLLAWVFDTDRSFSLQNVGKEMYEEIKKLTGQQHVAKIPAPDFIFRLEYDGELEAKFLMRRGDRKTLFAYHGSKVANFHSILRNGLRANLNQVSLYGEGTYLSPELSVSLNWSPMSCVPAAAAADHAAIAGARGAMEGVRLGCVAVCEVIDDPTGGGVAKSSDSATSDAATNTQSSGGNGSSSTSSGLRLASTNDVPDRYILVKNDDLVRIRYIFAYVDRSSARNELEGGRHICARLSAFCSRHRFWLIMLLYLLLLSAIGLANSNNFQWYVRRFWTSALTGSGYIDDEYPGNFHHG